MRFEHCEIVCGNHLKCLRSPANNPHVGPVVVVMAFVQGNEPSDQ